MEQQEEKPVIEEISPDPIQRKLVEAQLRRILAHPLFRQSKRLPTFLEFVVHQALSHPEGLPIKERAVGTQVFGRKPDYDTGSDPIVRVTATELRKKLAQYYYTDGRSETVRIEIPPGSYIPRFLPQTPQELEQRPNPAPDAGSDFEAPTEIWIEDNNAEVSGSDQMHSMATSLELPRGNSGVASKLTKFTQVMIGCATVLIILVAASLWRYSQRSSDALFWNPLCSSPSPILLVMPAIPPDKALPEVPTAHPSVMPTLSIEDTEVASRIAGQLEKRDAHYTFISGPSAGYSQIRGGPAVLIGALDNPWTMRLAAELPFAFQSDGNIGSLVDKSNSGKRYSIDIQTPHTHISTDFAIVARYWSRTSGQPIVIVAGISSQGTESAGEMVSTPQNLKRLMSAVGTKSNFEAILKTEAIDGIAGPPEIVELRTW